MSIIRKRSKRNKFTASVISDERLYFGLDISAFNHPFFITNCKRTILFPSIYWIGDNANEMYIQKLWCVQRMVIYDSLYIHGGQSRVTIVATYTIYNDILETLSLLG